MAQRDWSQCPAVESIPGKVSGAWIVKGRRLPAQTIFENLEACLSVKEITEVFDVTEQEVKAVLHFVTVCRRLRRSDENAVRQVLQGGVSGFIGNCASIEPNPLAMADKIAAS